MSDYLTDVRPAVDHLVAGIFSETVDLGELRSQRDGLTREIEDLERVAEFGMLNPDLDDDLLGVSSYWEAYFKQPELTSLQERIRALEATIAVK